MRKAICIASDEDARNGPGNLFSIMSHRPAATVPSQVVPNTAPWRCDGNDRLARKRVISELTGKKGADIHVRFYHQ